jgi:hypothetical protein
MISRRRILAAAGGLAALAAAGAGPVDAQEPCRRTREADRANNTEDRNNGDQTKRFTAFRQGPSGLFHRRGPHRPAVPDDLCLGAPRRVDHVPDQRWLIQHGFGMAHPSTRSDVDRHVRPRGVHPGAALSRKP